MKEIELNNIPVSSFFWKKDGTRWYLADVKDLCGYPDSNPTELVKLENEVVLSDPNYCNECWSELNWPPIGKCPVCGAIENNRHSFEEIKSFITHWCGAKEPHV